MHARYKTHMGDDLLVVDAARVSFAKESWYINGDYVPNKEHRRYEDWLAYYDQMQVRGDGDKTLSLADFGLIYFLAEHGHWTPMAHPQITLVMKAPVPIRTQCFKHKQGFVENEESRRYIKETPGLFIPHAYRKAPDNAKQGSAGRHDDSDYWRDEYIRQAKAGIRLYERMIEGCVAPEQARFVLPQGCEVQWYWTGSLAAFARFYSQRTDPHAQQEIQDLAREVGRHIEPAFPVAWAALTKGTQA